MKLLRDENGQTLVMVALSMTVLLGFTAFATDVGVLLHERREAQTAADSAAIAGATEALIEGTPSTLTTGMWDAASADAALNGFTGGTSSGTANNGTTLTVNIAPNITIAGYNTAGYVQATITHSTPNIFMKLFGFSSMPVSATAIASDTITSNGCIYVQNSGNYDFDDAVDMSGNSLILSPKCGMTVNGDINMQGNPSIDAEFVAAQGTIQGKNASSTWAEGVPPQTDPMPQLTQDVPTGPFVPPTNAGLTNGTCTAPANSGMTCYYDYQGGNLSGTLPTNSIFVFDEATGPTISGTVTMLNDTIYLVGNIPFDFSNNGSVTITPPGWVGTPTAGGLNCSQSTNPLCTVTIDAPTDGSNGSGTYTCSKGKGNNQSNPGELYFDFGSSNSDFLGVVYAPYAQLFTQDQGAGTTFDGDLIVGNICSQSSTFTVNGLSGPQSPLKRAGLVY